MKNYDIIFIHPPRVMTPDYNKIPLSVRNAFILIPMGLFAIADLCEREGFSVKILNYPLEQHFDQNWTLENFLKNIDFRICAIDLHWIHNAHGAIETAKIVKTINPNARVILGGYSASYYHDQILKHKAIDGIIRGEGEIPFLKYVQNVMHNRPLDSVPNLSYKDSSKHIKINSLSYAAKTLDDLNFTNVELLHNARQYLECSRKIMGIPFNLSIGRGCPFNCPCCGGGQKSQLILTGRKKVLLRSPEKVIEDIHAINDIYNIEGVFFGHGTYPASFKYWETLFKLIQKEKFDIGGDLEIWRLPLPKEMWNIFCRTFTRKYSSISVSPRTMSTRVQQKIAKICDPTFRFPVNQIQDLIKNANSFRTALRIWLTMGFPFQTHSDLLTDYLFAMKILLKYGKSYSQPVTVMSEPFYISPGSPVHEAPERFGVKLKYKSFPEIASLFKRTNMAFGNRVINYETDHFSNATIRITNLILFLSSAPMILTSN